MKLGERHGSLTSGRQVNCNKYDNLRKHLKGIASITYQKTIIECNSCDGLAYLIAEVAWKETL